VAIPYYQAGGYLMRLTVPSIEDMAHPEIVFVVWQPAEPIQFAPLPKDRKESVNLDRKPEWMAESVATLRWAEWRAAIRVRNRKGSRPKPGSRGNR
jgi:hypothetical protein